MDIEKTFDKEMIVQLIQDVFKIENIDNIIQKNLKEQTKKITCYNLNR